MANGLRDEKGVALRCSLGRFTEKRSVSETPRQKDKRMKDSTGLKFLRLGIIDSTDAAFIENEEEGWNEINFRMYEVRLILR